MPVFIFVSGFLSKNFIENKKIQKYKIINFFVLYIILRCLMFIVIKIFVNNNYEFNIFSAPNVCWYMLAMGFWYVLTFYLKKLNKLYVLIVSILLSCFVGYIKFDANILCYLRLISFYPFFLCGYYVNGCEKIKNKFMYFVKNKNNSIIGFILYILLFIFIYINIDTLFGYKNFLLNNKNYFDLGININLIWLIKLVYFCIALLMVLFFICIVPKKKTFFSVLGARTLQVYFLHRIIIYIMNYFMFNIFGKDYSAFLSLFMLLIGVILTFILSLKIFSYPFEYLNIILKKYFK